MTAETAEAIDAVMETETPVRRAYAVKSVTMDVAPFKAALTAASKAVPSRSPKVALQNVLIEIDPEGVSAVTGTDLQVGVRATFGGVKADGPVRLLLNPAKLRAMLDKPRADTFTLTINEPGEGFVSATVKCGPSRFVVPLEDDSLYPDTHRFSGENCITLSSYDLVTSARRTSYSADETNTRFAMGGSLLEWNVKAGELTVVATDGRRLAICVVPADPTGEGLVSKDQTIASVKFLKLLESLVDPEEESVSIEAKGNALVVRYGRGEIYGLMVQGRFPRYDDLVKSNSAGVAKHLGTIKAEDLLWAVNQAAVATSAESKGIDMTFKPGGMLPSTVNLHAMAADTGESDVTVDMESYTGSEVSITIDAYYFSQGLSSVPPDTLVEISLTDPKSAACLRSDADHWLYLVMPLTRQ